MQRTAFAALCSRVMIYEHGNPDKEAKLPLPHFSEKTEHQLSQSETMQGKYSQLQMQTSCSARGTSLSVPPNTCHRQITHTGLCLERKWSDSACAGVDYEVGNDELLKEMMLQVFPPYS